jgi:triacylglycerol lipase
MTSSSNIPSTNVQQTAAQNAVTLCALAVTSDPPSLIGSYLPGWSIVWNGVQTIDGNYAFIAADQAQQNYVLAIRGSVMGDIFKDWDAFANWVIEDLNVFVQFPWPYATTPKPLISAGANIAFANLLLMTDSSGIFITDYLINNVIKPGKQLSITGHSLGGNIANVYTSYFVYTVAKAGYSTGNISLFTFAAPAAGNADFADDLDAKLPNAWHYQNFNDVVPNFPVSLRVFLQGLLYIPSPLAGSITIPYNGQSITLREGFFTLSGMLSPFKYRQQSLNYIIFPTDLYSQFMSNSVKDWFGQAGSQHQIINYANYLGVSVNVQKAKAAMSM